MINTVDSIIRSATAFYSVLKEDENGRYRSWEHCYNDFCDARNGKYSEDQLSLMLGFYLASWGMYRGSSFLLQKDYKIHIPVVRELMDKKYDCLVGIRCIEYRKPEIQKLVFEDLQNSLKSYYRKVRSSVVEKEPVQDVSDTLVTKILMGTLACVLAYDRYFISGLKHEKVSTGNYNIKSILKIADFYEDNNQELELARKQLKAGKREYPQMKMIDMGFWQIGFDLDMEKGLQQAH